MKQLSILLLMTFLTGCGKHEPYQETKPVIQSAKGFHYGFEEKIYTEVKTPKWKGDIFLDFNEHHEGLKSLCMTTKSKREPNTFAYCAVIHGGAGKKLTFWAKTKDNGIFFVTTQQNWDQRLLISEGSTDWKQYEIPCIEGAIWFVAEGKGVVWIDNLRVE